MRFTDIFKLSIRMFRARTSRTLLTILGMSIGIGAILFLVSFGYGLQKTLLEKITTSESLLTLDVTEEKSANVALNDEIISEISNMKGVEEVSPSFQITARSKLENIYADMSVIAVEPSFFRLGGISVENGEPINDKNEEGVVITSALADIFGKKDQELIGKDISFIFYIPKSGAVNNKESASAKNESQDNLKKVVPDSKYKIIGIIKKDSSAAYVNSNSLKYLKMDRYAQIKVKSASNDKMKIIREKLLNRGLHVSSLSETVDQANKVFKVIQIVLMIFGIIALVVSAIGMFNTMTIALLERTEEIGIMKSIGASNLAISLMFIMEAAIMGFLGGIAGVFIGWIGGKLFNLGVNAIASHFGGESVNLFYIPYWFILTIIIFAGLVGTATGVVPARRASRIDPLDALRYK